MYGKTYKKEEQVKAVVKEELVEEDGEGKNKVTMATLLSENVGMVITSSDIYKPTSPSLAERVAMVTDNMTMEKVTMVTDKMTMEKVTMVTPSLTEERLRDFEITENMEIKSEAAEALPPLVHCPLYPKIECTTPSGSQLPFTFEHRAEIPILETLSNIVGSLFKNNNKLDKRKSVEVQTLCPGSEATRFRHVEQAQKVCTQCNKVFSQKMHLQRHIKSVHDVIRDNFCTFCGKGFTLKSHLMEHIRAVHFKIKNRVCPVCDWKFHRQGDLNRHIKAVHRDGKVKKYTRKKQRLEEPVIRTELQENTVVTVDGINGDKGQVLECLEVYSKEASHRARKEKHGSVLNLLENALADYSANQDPTDDTVTGSTSVSIEQAGTHCANNSNSPNNRYHGNNSRKRVVSSNGTSFKIKEELMEHVAFPQINIEPVMQNVKNSASGGRGVAEFAPSLVDASQADDTLKFLLKLQKGDL